MRLLFASLLLILWPLLATAQSVQEQVISQLRNQGYTEISVSRTLLGRLRFVAISPDLERELIVNPATGEIIRDFWTQRSDADDPGSVIVPRAPSAAAEDRREERAERREERQDRREERQDRRDDRDDDDDDDDNDDDDDDDGDDD